jgi:hypothetical protein
MASAPEPETIRANTTLQWTRSISGYDAATWTASYRLTSSNDLTPITIPTTGSGTNYTVDVKPIVSATYAAATYVWNLTVTDGTDTFHIDSGVAQVISQDATGNELLDAKQYLIDAETELAARAAGKAESYSIKDRSLTRTSSSELMNIIKYWRTRVGVLENAERVRKGLPSKSITYARF